MSDFNAQLSGTIDYWANMNAQAEAGTLTVPPDVAAKCDAACVAYIEHLRGMVIYNKTDGLVQVKAFGDMQSGKDLGAKFARMATGTPRSLDAILLQHIDIVQSMREFFRRYFDDHTSIDDQTAVEIGALNPEN